MIPDGMPLDQNRIIQQLERRIAALEEQVRQTKGVPITQASAAFYLPNMSAPATPSGGIRLYSTLSGEGRWVDPAGVHRSLIPPAVPQAGFVSAPNSFVVSSAPGAYNSGWGQDVVNCLSNMHSTLSSVLTNMKSSGVMSPF